MTGPILLVCLHCNREMDYARDIDPGIPDCVAVIEHTRCDDCDNGDFGQEFWFDADGREVSQDTHT